MTFDKSQSTGQFICLGDCGGGGNRSFERSSSGALPKAQRNSVQRAGSQDLDSYPRQPFSHRLTAGARGKPCLLPKQSVDFSPGRPVILFKREAGDSSFVWGVPSGILLTAAN